MSNQFDNTRQELDQALEQVRQMQKAIADKAASMARLLKGNLRHCDGYTLAELKRELHDFDATRKKWKNR